MINKPFIAHSEITNEIYIVTKKDKYCVTKQVEKAVVATDKAILKADVMNTLKEIREEIDQRQYSYMADKDYDEGIRFGLMLAYQSIDKKISELEDNGRDGKDILQL